MVVIYKTENTKVYPVKGGAIFLSPRPYAMYGSGSCINKNGGAIYLSPRPYAMYGSGLYLNQNGEGIFDVISSIGNFIRDNKDIISTTAQAGSNVASAISSIKQAMDSSKKVDLIKQIAENSKKTKTKKELTPEQKKIIDEALGNGLKRF